MILDIFLYTFEPHFLVENNNAHHKKLLDDLTKERAALAQKYLQGIKNPKIQLPELQFGEEGHVFHLFVIETENRAELIEYLKKHDIDPKIKEKIT